MTRIFYLPKQPAVTYLFFSLSALPFCIHLSLVSPMLFRTCRIIINKFINHLFTNLMYTSYFRHVRNLLSKWNNFLKSQFTKKNSIDRLTYFTTCRSIIRLFSKLASILHLLIPTCYVNIWWSKQSYFSRYLRYPL